MTKSNNGTLRRVRVTLLQLVAVSVALGVFCPGDADGATDSKVGAAAESRIAFVEKLIFESSAARNVEKSGDAQAEALKVEAEQHFERARDLISSGEIPAAERELDQAVRSMQAAVRALDGGISGDARGLEEIERRRRTVEALLAAHRHVADQKGVEDEHRELASRVESELAVVDEQVREGRVAEARGSLDTIYQEVRSAVESLREGDTLVRELRFESDEDEYLYELDRNDTHRMLIQVLLAERLTDERLAAMAGEMIGSAQSLRDDAESAAEQEQFDAAIELLERSTQELIRAIRSAGIYIPG